MTHRTATREEWLDERIALLEREKELTRQTDELARRRRELPWVAIDKEYVFDTPDGERTLAELFHGRSQLLVYHFMLGPDTPEGCVGCTYSADDWSGAVFHLEQHGVSFVLASRAPLAEIDAYKRRMGWTFSWVSSGGTDFNVDFVTYPDDHGRRRTGFNFRPPPADGKQVMPGMEIMALSAFALDDGVVYHTYSCMDRGTDGIHSTWQLLDRAPLGRDPAPEGWPVRRA
jgi:predicted dithiol-disulfide oxidoreductase (DUF899 family)